MQAVSLLDVVVEHCGQQIVSCPDGMEVTGKMKVDIFHGNHLRIPAAGCTAFDPEYRAERGLSQGNCHILTDTLQPIRQADGRGGFSLPCRGRCYGSNQYQLPVFPIALTQQGLIDFCFVTPLLFQILLINMRPCGDLPDGAKLTCLCNFNIGFIFHPVPPDYLKYCTADSNMRIL